VDWIGQTTGDCTRTQSEGQKKSSLARREDPFEDTETVDLHGLTVEQALRRVAQALHTARVRGWTRLLVVTGAGWSNPDLKPVLRPRVEAWLRGPEGRALGVKDVQRVHRDGALDVLLN